MFSEAFLVSVVALLFLDYINPEPVREVLLLPVLILIFVGILISPLLETFISQTMAIFLVKKFKGSFDLQVLISTLIFLIFHFGSGLNATIVVGFIGGIYFAYTYAFILEKTNKHHLAYWLTTLSHFLRNLIAISLFLIGNKIAP